LGVGFIWPLILGGGVLLFPETPRFDYRKGEIERAKQTMLKVYGAPPNHYSVHLELEEIEAKLRAEAVQEGFIREWIHMFSAPKMAQRIALGMLLQMFQQLTGAKLTDKASKNFTLIDLIGANYFFYYGTTIFQVSQPRHIQPEWDFGSLIIGYWYQQLLCHPNDLERHQLRHDILWSLYC